MIIDNEPMCDSRDVNAYCETIINEPNQVLIFVLPEKLIEDLNMKWQTHLKSIEVKFKQQSNT